MSATATKPAAPALRDYQQESVDGVRENFNKRPILVCPTGAGKTVMGGFIAVKTQSNGKRVLWLAHRSELIEQADAALVKAGCRTGIIMAGVKEDRRAPVQVASIQTLARRPLPEADVVIVDECHHARAATYAVVLDKYAQRGAIIIGLTATPERLDGRGLGALFGAIVECVTTRELIERGFLAPYRYFAPYVPDLSGIRKVGGDYSKKGIAGAMDRSTITGDIVKHYKNRIDGRKALVFACSIAHSEALVKQFNASGVAAAHLDGTTPTAERREVLRQFRAGTIRVVSNVDLFGEGFDCPDIEAVIIARPTQSFSMHRQMIGRALRIADGKEYAVVLDHAGNFLRHGMPDDGVEWTLEDKPSKRSDAAKHKTCKNCFAVVPTHLDRCPRCGFMFVGKPRVGPEFEDGTLTEVKVKKWSDQEKRELFDSVLGKARALGYMAAWAKRQYRLKTGVWPRNMKDLEDRHVELCEHFKLDAATDRCKFCGEYRGTGHADYEAPAQP